MTVNESITVDRITEALDTEEDVGFCLLCGKPAYGVEPDARKYVCESCGAPRVYGAEEILLTLVA